MKRIEIELPIYADITKDKRKLVSMNWYRNAHYHEESKIKKIYHGIVSNLLQDREKLHGDIQVNYKLYYKNKQCDLMNVVSIIDKYLLDALQEIGIIENDNVLNYKHCNIEVIGQDRDQPRVICEVIGAGTNEI